MMKKMLVDLIKDYEKSSSYWHGSIFERVTKFSTDFKGRFGEEFLYTIIKNLTEIPVMWDADCNTSNEEGIYDIFWYLPNNKKMRVEIKTSGRTVSNGRPVGWQHENVYFTNNDWDKIIFLDYDTDNIMYITIVDYDSIVKNGILDLSVFGKKAHQRKNEEGKAKVDFSYKSIKKGIEAGITLKYDLEAPQNDILAKFLVEKLS